MKKRKKGLQSSLLQAYLGGHARSIVQAKLVHDPLGFDPVRCSAFVENQSFAHPYQLL